jgi:glucose-1-phosphate adenylyltransferase
MNKKNRKLVTHYWVLAIRCYINNAIVDKNCKIGNDVRINGGAHLKEGDYGLYVVKDGIVVVKKGATIPNGTVI